MANKYDAIMEQLGACFKWTDPQFRPPSATEENLKEVEAKIGYPLSADYREFLRDYGGAVLHATYPVWEGSQQRTEYLSYFDGKAPDRISIANNYHFFLEQYDLDSDSISQYPGLSLVHPLEVSEEYEKIGWPPELLPIASNGAGSELCLALFGLRPKAIFLLRSLPHPDAQNVYLVANSFDEFTHLLRKDE